MQNRGLNFTLFEREYGKLSFIEEQVVIYMGADPLMNYEQARREAERFWDSIPRHEQDILIQDAILVQRMNALLGPN